MILTIDVGNTHTVLGVYKLEELLFTFRMRTQSNKTEDELFSIILPVLQNHGLETKDFRKL